MKELLIFDLDGTLIDSKRDLADSVNAMRVHLHEPPLTDETVYSYVGNGAPALVRRALPGRDEEEILRGLAFFLAYYRDHMLDATTLYPGVREALRRHLHQTPQGAAKNRIPALHESIDAGGTTKAW